MGFVQQQLDESQKKLCKESAEKLKWAFPWIDSMEGASFWKDVYSKLSNKSIYGTNDGLPWVEPVPDTTESFRPAVPEDMLTRPRCRVRNLLRGGWKYGTLHIVSNNKACFIECDGVYSWWHIDEVEVETTPKLWRIPTDEDAKLRPSCRCRDRLEQPWKSGTLLTVDENPSCSYRFFIRDEDGVMRWFVCCEIEE